MHPPLGLSVGTTNFVAVTAGEPPVVRRSSLALSPQGPPQIGSPAGGAGWLTIDGFVDCAGTQTPLVAADGSTHQPEVLVADAIEAMVGAAGATASQLAIAVPAHWPTGAWQALQEALHTRATLSTLGTPPCLVSDAVAALTALHADRGVASRGVVALLDFGGGGTSISLADAGSGFQPIGETLRYRGFSGNLIDQTILSYIVGGTDQGGDAGPGGTATIGDLAQLTDQCRQAKERLSEQAAAELVAPLPGYEARLALTRAEFEDLIRSPLDGVVAALEEVLRRNGIDWRDLAAIATVGGGARIPLVTDRLSAGQPAPVVTSQLPTLAMAVGAALCVSADGGEEAPATTMAAAAPAAKTAAGAAVRYGGTEQPDPAPRELAWSEEEVHDEPVPYVGEPYSVPAASSAPGRRSHRVPQLVAGLVALAAMVGIGGGTYALTSASHDKAPAKPAPAAPPSPDRPAPAQAAGPPGPGSPAAPPPAPASPVAAPPTTTTAPPPTTTTTTAAPTTTTTTTTTTTATTTTTTTTTTPPPSTTNATTATTAAAPMTTEYLTLPLVPVPIPIQVPAN